MVTEIIVKGRSTTTRIPVQHAGMSAYDGLFINVRKLRHLRSKLVMQHTQVGDLINSLDEYITDIDRTLERAEP